MTSFAFILSYICMCGSGSVFRIRIRIQEAPENGYNTDPEPQHLLKPCVSHFQVRRRGRTCSCCVARWWAVWWTSCGAVGPATPSSPPRQSYSAIDRCCCQLTSTQGQTISVPDPYHNPGSGSLSNDMDPNPTKSNDRYLWTRIRQKPQVTDRAVDPHSFYADPDPAVLLNADPDPDPDPGPGPA